MASKNTQPNGEVRIEKDSMGKVEVPAQAYYGAQTQRAVENFPVSGWEMAPAMIAAMGRVKYGCGVANRDLKKLTDSHRWKTERPVPDRCVPNRIGNIEQYERQ